MNEPVCPKCSAAPGEACRYEGPCIWFEDEDDEDCCYHGVPFCDYCEWCVIDRGDPMTAPVPDYTYRQLRKAVREAVHLLDEALGDSDLIGTEDDDPVFKAMQILSRALRRQKTT